jgi:hypothetical protein
MIYFKIIIINIIKKETVQKDSFNAKTLRHPDSYRDSVTNGLTEICHAELVEV